MSYIDIPLTHEHIFFDIIDHQTDDPVVNPQFPIGIGMNFGTLYDLGCRIRIHELLSEYHLSFSDVLSATLYLYGTTSVGDMDVYSTSGAISDSPITPTNFNYEIPLEDTYDSTYCGYLFKMSTLSAISYSTFINTGSYVRIEFYDNTSIYVSSLPTKRNYFYGEQLDLTGLKIKFIKNDSTEVEIFNYTSTPLNNAYLYPTNNTVTFYYALGNAIKTCSIQINVDNTKEDILYDTSALDGSGNEMHDFDIHMPSTPPPQNGFPVVVTIHGGDFTEGDKADYDYIEPFLNSNGCIHVNMNYRLMSISNENNIYTNTNGIHYQDMLGDIKSLINYLYSSISIYHIDISNLYLMGYSAGGYLALMYSYKDNTANIPIKGVISEAGPTIFELNEIDDIIYLLCGLDDLDNDEAKSIALSNASPYSNELTTNINTFLTYSLNDTKVPYYLGCTLFKTIARTNCNNTCLNNEPLCHIENSHSLHKFKLLLNLTHSDISHLIDFNNDTHPDVQAYYLALSNFLS